ncbi:7-carboxy-7-deazaguanine synthase QueE [Bacteroidales bacterium OttesenSCG-928-I14]|nr:7-carboxy-7-deazaguanine synthase QueE [Bacteroidales bacterium OttesenSCG-928-I14]
MNLKVNEIFYSLQGEGGRQGEASIFIRLSGCNLKCDFCDTSHEEGVFMTEQEILDSISKYPCRWIVWTGGEPSLQLNDDILRYFHDKGYFQAVESNGHYPLSDLFDYKVVSPKGKNIDYARLKNANVEEVRLPVNKGDIIPEISSLPKAKHYFLSPVFLSEETRTQGNIAYCVSYIMQNTNWHLSLQIHKLIGIE